MCTRCCIVPRRLKSTAQGLAFAIFSKVYAISHGLLPADKRLSKLFRVLTLEVGLILGILLLIGGLAGSVAALLWWRSEGYGALDVDRVLRLVVPSILAVTLGFQAILSSFFLSVLGLGIRRDGRDRRHELRDRFWSRGHLRRSSAARTGLVRHDA